MIAARLTLLLSFCWLASPSPAQEPDFPEPEAAMPEGFPEPTAPGVVEVKQYPAYRSAWTKGEGMNQRSGDMLFFWLFQHINERQVEMTAPVINTYLDPEVAVDPSHQGDLSMEFLYERPDQGETGKGVGPVEVKDMPPMTVIALGFQGDMTPELMADGVKQLRSWLEEHADEWTEAGPPRRLGYHSPMAPDDQRLWEIQLPIQPAGEPSEPQSSAPESPSAP